MLHVAQYIDRSLKEDGVAVQKEQAVTLVRFIIYVTRYIYIYLCHCSLELRNNIVVSKTYRMCNFLFEREVPLKKTRSWLKPSHTIIL